MTTDSTAAAIQAARAQALAELMQLGGAKVGTGDVLTALGPLGLFLVADGPAGTDYAEAADAMLSLVDSVTERGTCRKCGHVTVRRSDRDRGYWHERDGWGYQRACRGPE